MLLDAHRRDVAWASHRDARLVERNERELDCRVAHGTSVDEVPDASLFLPAKAASRVFVVIRARDFAERGRLSV